MMIMHIGITHIGTIEATLTSTLLPEDLDQGSPILGVTISWGTPIMAIHSLLSITDSLSSSSTTSSLQLQGQMHQEPIACLTINQVQHQSILNLEVAPFGPTTNIITTLAPHVEDIIPNQDLGAAHPEPSQTARIALTQAEAAVQAQEAVLREAKAILRQ